MRAEIEGDKYIVDGQKMWEYPCIVLIIDGYRQQHAPQVSHILLFARPAAPDPKSLTAALSLCYRRLNHSHITIRPLPKMARQAIDSNKLFFDFPIPNWFSQG